LSIFWSLRFRHAIALFSLSFVASLFGTISVLYRDGVETSVAIDAAVAFFLIWWCVGLMASLVGLMASLIHDGEKTMRDVFWVGKQQSSVNDVCKGGSFPCTATFPPPFKPNRERTCGRSPFYFPLGRVFAHHHAQRDNFIPSTLSLPGIPSPLTGPSCTPC
jgi:hypothetical protein